MNHLIGYHGAPKFVAKKIFRTGLIELTNRHNRTYLDTTLGYVHLTVDVPLAIDFALRAVGKAIMDGKTDKFDIVVFKVCLTERTHIFADEDELTGSDISDLSESIEETGTFRVNKQLLLGKDVTGYLSIKLNGTEQGYKLVDSGRFQDSTALNWKAL